MQPTSVRPANVRVLVHSHSRVECYNAEARWKRVVLGDGEAGEGYEKKEGGKDRKREALLRFIVNMAWIVGNQDGEGLLLLCCGVESSKRTIIWKIWRHTCI